MGQIGAALSETRPTEIKQRASLKRAHAKEKPIKLPRGLIGTKCTAQVTISDQEVNCLLDTGSQVTTVPLSFYEQHLSSQAIKPLNNLLEVEGANGQEVPYLGYVELSITFPKEFLGVDTEVPTVALVVPQLRAQEQVLIGTNTLDVLYTGYAQKNDALHQPTSIGYRTVLKLLELRQQQAVGGNLGLVSMQGKTPEVIPAGRTVVLEGCVSVHASYTDKWAILEPPSTSSLPGGLFVSSCLLTLPTTRHHSRLPVVLKNETEHDITIPPRTVLAEVNAIQSVMQKEPTTTESNCADKPDSSNLNYDFGDSPISTEWRERVTSKLNSMPEVFSHHDLDFGHTDKVKHHIKLSDETPFKHRARPIHPQDLEAVRKHLQELLDSGVIRESESPFSSPIVVVKKKNGDVRLCIDYRKLNLQTIKDAYALPQLEDTFSALTGSKWFTVLDLKSGFYQIEMEEADKQKTAFVCPLGFWEFCRMPQGITNAPSTFQRLMERCMGDINLREVVVFIDDLIVFSETLEEHESRLLRVLSRLKEYGLKLSPEKCRFFQTSVRYLGHIVSQDGVETDPEKIKALSTWPIPRTLKELRSFLGFSGYYRRFIKDYSGIVKPLNDLTSGYPPLRKGSKPTKEQSAQYHNPKEPFGSRWTPACQQAFQTIIDKLTSAPVLGFADPKLPYILHTDASTTGLGAALYQEQEGRMRVIAFASRGLTRSESRYPAHKLEFLALKWSVTEKYKDYLYGCPFTVVTDSNPLTYILTSAKLDATSYRWLAALSTFSFKLQYRAGKQNQDADGLSRRPHGELSDDLTSQKERERIRQFTRHHLADLDVIQAICERNLVCQVTDNDSDSADPGITLVESLAISSDAIPNSFEQDGSSVIPHLSEEELKDKQRADPSIREVILQMESGEKPPPTARAELPELPLLLREWNRLELRSGVLYRRRQDGAQQTAQLVLPEELRSLVLTSLHDDMGHMGIDRTLDLVRSRFYWPKMASAVENKIKTCNRCVRRKALPEKAAPLVNIKTSRPLELVCMDYLSLEPDRSNTKDILVITDHFTKYAVAIPTPNQKARTVAKTLWDHFIIHYGFPERLHSDQGPDFESKTIKELCEIGGIRKVRTTPYHPRGNPVERFNRTLLQMLGTLESEDKVHWRDFVKPLVHAYNCTKNDVTGFTPYELMFGRQPRLPVDLAFGLPVHNQKKSHSQYVKDLKRNLEESYRVATRNASKTAERNKTRFDKRVTESTLEVGDRVLVRNVRLRGKHKLADKWESAIYVVVKRAGDLPVYTVRPETKDGPLRTLHRDLLLPCGFLPATEPEKPVTPKPAQRPHTRRNPGVDDAETHSVEGVETSDVDDAESGEDVPVQWSTDPPTLEPVTFTKVYETRRWSSRRPHCTANAEEQSKSDLVPSTSSRPVELTPAADEVSDDVPVDNLPEVDNPPKVDNLPEDNPPEQYNIPGNDDLPYDPPGKTTENESSKEKSDNEEVRTGAPEVVTVESTPVDAEPAEDIAVKDVIEEAGNIPRRSVRQREKREKVQFSNPLVSVIQSLFQGFSTAFTNSLDQVDYMSVISQPHSRCNETCAISRGEGVTQVI